MFVKILFDYCFVRFVDDVLSFCSVDESLIGGMVIRIGDRVVDSSIKHKIDELSRSLMKIQL